jgi:hypothetical protein
MNEIEVDSLLLRPAFARGGKRELRQDVDAEVLQVLDAVSLARDITRAELVSEILGRYAKQRLHERMLIDRLLRSNPADADASGHPAHGTHAAQ